MTTPLAEQEISCLPGPAALTFPAPAWDYPLGPPSDTSWSHPADAHQAPEESAHPESLQWPPGPTVRLLDCKRMSGRWHEEQPGNLPDTVKAYDDRISVLEEQAANDGNFLNARSRETFQVFFKTNPLIRLGSLFLLESGNIRAVWKGDGASHVGLQFLDNSLIQYVLFRQRHADVPVSRAYGRDTPTGVLEQISALELDQVLYR